MLGERDKAADAYEHAAKLEPKDAEILLAEAEALLPGHERRDADLRRASSRSCSAWRRWRPRSRRRCGIWASPRRRRTSFDDGARAIGSVSSDAPARRRRAQNGHGGPRRDQGEVGGATPR